MSFLQKVGVNQASVLSPFSFATVIDLVTEVRKRLFHEILYTDELVFMSDFIKGIRRKFANWKDLFLRQQLKNKIGGSGSKSKLLVVFVEGHQKFSLCVKCRTWTHERCTN